MKIRKILASLFATTMLVTMISSFTVVKAAEAPVLTAETGYEDGCITVTVSYSGFENFVTYSGSRKTNVRGISALEFKLALSGKDADSVVYDGAEGTSAGQNAPTYGFLATSKDLYNTNTEGVCATYYFVADEDAVVTFDIVDPVIAVEESISGVASPTVSYVGSQVKCVGATYGEVAADIVVDEKAYELAPSPSNPETKTVGFKATVNKAAQYVKLAFDGAKAPVVIDFGVSIDATKTFGLNIMKVPAGKTITAPTAEIIDALSGEAGTDYILAR